MKSTRGRAATISVVVVAAVLLGGCGPMQSEPENSRTAQQDHALVREAVTGLPGTEGAIRVDQFSDRSCLNSEQSNRQTNSKWLAVLTAESSTEASSDNVFSRIDRWATSHGYEKKQDQRGAEREAGWVKPGVTIGAGSQMNGGVEVVIQAPCRDHPESHKLYRDELDPEFGVTDPVYEDGNRNAVASSSSSP